jgi:uncharacterized damage-inducible protein DinB
MIAKPTNIDTSLYYMRYLEVVQGDDLLEALAANQYDTLNLIHDISNKQLRFSYAEGKWNVGFLLQHICDAERVYAYRALRFLRKDSTNLPGFDENDYANNSPGYKTTAEFIEEFNAIRNASIALFKLSDLENLDFKGKANNLEMTPRILGWLMVGHCLHHMNVLEERYLLRAKN